MKKTIYQALAMGLACSSALLLSAASVEAAPASGYASAADTSANNSAPLTVEEADNEKFNYFTSEDAARSGQAFSLGNKLGTGSDAKYRLSGFASTGFSYANLPSDSIYRIPEFGSVGDNITFSPNTLIGLQFSFNLTDKIDVVTQLVSSGDGDNGKTAFIPNATWAYIKYEATDNVSVLAGRFRIPAFLYSETQQVGYTYPWLYLPNEVYRILPFQDMNGVSASYVLPLGESGLWNMSVNPYYGVTNLEFDFYGTDGPYSRRAPNEDAAGYPTGSPGYCYESAQDGVECEETGLFLGAGDFKLNNIIGIAVNIGSNNFLIHMNYFHTDLSAQLPKSALSGDPANDALADPSESAASTFDIGLMVNLDRLHMSAEYAARYVDNAIASLNGYYAMIGYDIGEFMPYFTFGGIDTTTRDSSVQNPNNTLGVKALDPIELQNIPEFENYQKQYSYTFGLTYRPLNFMVVKASASYITPQDAPKPVSTNIDDVDFNNNYGLASGPSKGNFWVLGMGVSVIF